MDNELAEARIKLLEKLLREALDYSPSAYMEMLRAAAWPPNSPLQQGKENG